MGVKTAAAFRTTALAFAGSQPPAPAQMMRLWSCGFFALPAFGFFAQHPCDTCVDGLCCVCWLTEDYMGDAAMSLLVLVLWLVGSVMGLCAGMLIGDDSQPFFVVTHAA